MRIKNQLKVWGLVATLPENGMNHYRGIKRLVEGKCLTPQRAFDLYKKNNDL